jgi:hypothetical protein
MHPESKLRAAAGLIAVVAGVALIGSSSAVFPLGWALWATGLAALLSALPTAGESRRAGAVSMLPAAVGDRRAA